MIRLSKSGIEYFDYAWNFYSGCDNKKLGICQVQNCWAKGITVRFPDYYPNGFEPTYYPEAFLSPLHLKKPSIIGCAFMGDLFGDWVDPDKKFHSLMPSGKASVSMSLKGWIFTTIEQCPQHTFLFLTKCPRNLPQWGPFPNNCQVGVTITHREMAHTTNFYLPNVEAKVKFISFEPLLDIVSEYLYFPNLIKSVQWVIIGAQTKPAVYPKKEWVEEILRACRKAGVPVFLKDNLGGMDMRGEWDRDLWLGPGLTLRQEVPGGK